MHCTRPAYPGVESTVCGFVKGFRFAKSVPLTRRLVSFNVIVQIFGGVDINPNFSAEFGYIDFGEFSAHYPLYDETDRAEGSALFVAAVGQANITEQLRLFGKVGFDYWNVDISADATYLGTPISGSGDGTGIDLLYGIGLNFKATDRLSIRAEWERYKDVADGVDITFAGLGSIEVEGEDVDVLGVALLYNF